MDHRSGVQRTAPINVTPLVDVCLVLLIIFLAANQTRFGYEAAIPREQSVIDRPPSDRPLVVSLKSNGEVFLNRERIEPGSLFSRLQMNLVNRPDRLVFFTSDDGVRYGEAMVIIDEMNRAGAKIGIAATL